MGPRILVPLCGKTVDMVYLARLGYRVVGVDGVRKAIEDFAKDFGLKVPTAKGPTMHVNFPPELEPSRFRGHAVLMPAGPEDGSRHEPPPPVIFVEGDFLGLGPEQAKALVPFEAAFDRGGFVAVEPCDRQLYADTLGHLMAPGGRILLVAVEHDGFAGGKRGPPYQVTAEEMQKYFGGRFALQRLGGAEALDEALRARGATRGLGNQQVDLLVAALSLASKCVGEVCVPVASVLPQLQVEDRDVEGMIYATPNIGFDVLKEGVKTGRAYLSFETKNPPAKQSLGGESWCALNN
ncbi:tpm [Symbiodinium sp. KB8]|nr:tpm [Symbiodinium sp. KB8]